jgi:hypothetical protein
LAKWAILSESSEEKPRPEIAKNGGEFASGWVGTIVSWEMNVLVPEATNRCLLHLRMKPLFAALLALLSATCAFAAEALPAPAAPLRKIAIQPLGKVSADILAEARKSLEGLYEVKWSCCRRRNCRNRRSTSRASGSARRGCSIWLHAEYGCGVHEDRRPDAIGHLDDEG